MKAPNRIKPLDIPETWKECRIHGANLDELARMQLTIDTGVCVLATGDMITLKPMQGNRRGTIKPPTKNFPAILAQIQFQNPTAEILFY